MKKYMRIFIVLITLLVFIELLFLFFYKGRDVQYEIKEGSNQFYVYEKYVKNKEVSYYYLEIEFSSKIFNLRVPAIFGNDSYIIKDIYSFIDDSYTCVLPIFKDDTIQTDILCYLDDEKVIYPYRNLQNDSLKLDKFAYSMEEYGYEISKSNDESDSSSGITVFENIADSHVIVMPSYDGVFIIDEDISSLYLFASDVYTQSIQGVVSNYYVVADYDEVYSFHEFKVVDVTTGKVTYLYSDTSISTNSYVQGTVDDSMYIIDRSNKKQYKLDVSNMTITLVGNSKKGILYYNGSEFETKSIYAAINEELLFDTSLSSDTYDYVYLVNGIYYSYKKVNGGYDVYASYIDKPSIYTYAFFASSMSRIQYVEDYVYYVEGDTLYSYHLKDGVNEVLTYSELYYNPKLKFWIYKK